MALLGCVALALACTRNQPDPETPPETPPVHVEAEPSEQPPPVEAVERYPNELPGYEFFATASWRELVPLESTLADVRRVLGEPTDARDIAHYVKPYPGDDAAEQPVLTYDISPEWQLLVYLVKTNMSVRDKYPDHVQDKLLSLDLVPKHEHQFTGSFSERWTVKKVRAADAGWLEYSDGSGLVYQVYTSKTPHGGDEPGDLNRISYGPSDAQLQALGVEK